MTPEILPVLGMTITILGAIWAMNQSLRGEIKDVRGEIKDVRGEIKDLHEEMQKGFKAADEKFIDMRADMGKLSERMARVEGMIDGLREAIAARAVA